MSFENVLKSSNLPVQASGNTTKHDKNMEHQSGKIKCSQLSSVSVIAQNKCSVVSAFLWEELKVIDETNS